MRDVLAVPDWFEETVREAEREDVERGFLPQEVVDAEDLALVEGRVQRVVELHRARKIGAERLLHDDARAFGEADRAELVHYLGGGGGRHAQVVHPRDVAAELVFELLDQLRQRLAPGRLAHVGETRREVVPVVLGHAAVRELVERGARVGAEAVVVEVVERRADDPALGQQARLREVEQPGEQLAAGEVTGRAEQHHDVRTEWRRQEVRVDVGRIGVHARRPPWTSLRRPCAEPVSRGLREQDDYMNGPGFHRHIRGRQETPASQRRFSAPCTLTTQTIQDLTAGPACITM